MALARWTIVGTCIVKHTTNEHNPFHFHSIPLAPIAGVYVWFIHSFIYLSVAMIVEIQWNHVRFAQFVYCRMIRISTDESRWFWRIYRITLINYNGFVDLTQTYACQVAGWRTGEMICEASWNVLNAKNVEILKFGNTGRSNSFYAILLWIFRKKLLIIESNTTCLLNQCSAVRHF